MAASDMHDVLKLARMHVESAYELSADGRIMRIREPEPGQPPPRFGLIRTREGHISLVRHDVPASAASLLLRLAGSEPRLDDPLATPAHLHAYVAALSEHAPVERKAAGPAFVLPAPTTVPRDVTRISIGNATLLERHFAWAIRYLDIYSPLCAVVEDAVAVALCFSAREPSPGIEAGVFTVEEYRGRGYAQRVVAAWAQGILEAGRLPLYSTSWENTASRRIAERLGGELYAVDFSLT
ncbi:MAG: GNAT family N-acetyltransferase [Dehalococcoidia bacterium]